MRIKRRTQAIGLGIICIITLIIIMGISFNASKVIMADAIETTHNTTLDVDEVRIDGWRALRDMTALRFRPNAKTLSLISVGLN